MNKRCIICQKLISLRQAFKLCNACLSSIKSVLYEKTLLTRQGNEYRIFIPYVYSGAIKQAIDLLKFSRDIRMANLFCLLLLQSFSFRFNPDLVVPVPSHPLEELKRGFSHMGYVSHLLSKKMGIASYCALKRSMLPLIGRTQKSRDKHKRASIGKSIYIERKEYEALKGKNILLIDDISTTGESIRSCVDSLAKGGVAKIHAVCLALTLC